MDSSAPVLGEGLICVKTCTSTITTDDKPVADFNENGSSGLTASESPVVSEHRLDQEITLNLKEHEIEVLKQSADLAEEKHPISDSLPDTQEIHANEHEKLEVQKSEETSRNLSFNELYPSGTLKLQYNFDTIEPQFCDLPDNKDSADCDIAEADFSLILEGEEGEVETDDSAPSGVLPKVANTATKEKIVCNVEGGNRGHTANLPPPITSDQESQKVETLPFVPEPIKVAIAKNLLDVTKDTRSKEITSDTVEQSMHENLPLISQKVMCSTKLVKRTLKTVQEIDAVTINVSQSDGAVSSRTRTRQQHVQNLGITSKPQEESADIGTPKILGSPARKKTRQTKEISEASESAYADVKGRPQKQQVPQSSLSSKRGKNKKDVNQGSLESITSVEQETQVILGREPKKSKSSQLLEPAIEETSTKEVKLFSVTKRTPKKIEKSVENQECIGIVSAVTVNNIASPSRTTKKLRNANLEASENKRYKQDGKLNDQQLSVRRSKRVEEREISMSGVTEESKFGLSQLTLQAEFDVSATPRKRGRPRKINPLQDVGSKADEKERSPKRTKVLIVRRSARNTPARNESISVGEPVLEKSIIVPSEELDMVISSKKKLTKKTENQSQKCALYSVSEEHVDEVTHKEPDGQEKRWLSTTAFIQSSRSIRTRSSKAISLQDFSEPNETLLSPTVKVSRKVKAERIETPTQLKELVSDLSTQFVFSPPTLRTTRKSMSSTSRLVGELEDDAKPVEIVGEQEVKKFRTTKTKQTNKNTEKDSFWSPPPVEIKLISPLASPGDGIKSKPRKTAEVTRKAVGRRGKKPSSFPKQVLRRKML